MRTEETGPQKRSARPPVAGALGLCAKAGKLVFGTSMICEALKVHKSGKTPLLVVMARDASENTVKRLQDRCRYYGLPCVAAPLDTETLGRAVGKSPLAAVGVLDENLARLVETKLAGVPQEPSETVGRAEAAGETERRDADP